LNKRKTAGTVLIVLGLIILCSALGMRLWGYYKQQKLINDFQKTIENVDKTKDNSNTKLPSLDVNSDGVIGIMEIPKINLKTPIGEGVDMETLKFAVGHFKGTALPGQNGNFCVAGHRSYTYSEYFNRLDELKKGDKIIIITKTEEFNYIVTDSFVVEPTHTEVLNNTKDATLTLVTCTPLRIATHRLIIKATLKK
jgi:sortase A